MLIADAYLGHREEDRIARRLAETDAHRVVLSDTDRRRSHVRTETREGRELGVAVGRILGNGAVLETESGALVVVELEPIEALVIGFDGSDVAATTALELGHVIGNHHWELAIRETEALIRGGESLERMDAALSESLPADVTVHHEHVLPTTFDEAPEPHSHGDGHAHAHSREVER